MSSSHQRPGSSSESIGTPASDKVEKRKRKRRHLPNPATQGVLSFWADHYMASVARKLPADDIFSFYQTIVGQDSIDQRCFMSISGRYGFNMLRNRKERADKNYPVTWRSDSCRKYHAEHSASHLAAKDGPKYEQTLGSSEGSNIIVDEYPLYCIYRLKGCLWKGDINERLCHTGKCGYKELPLPLLSSEVVKEVHGHLNHDCRRLIENVGSQLVSLDESYLTSLDKRYEEELQERIEEDQLAEEMKLLKEKNVRLLDEVSVLLEEEREQREFQTHLLVIDQLRSILESLQNEIAPLTENDPGLDPVNTLESTNALTKILNDCGSFVRGISRVVSDTKCEQIGNERKKCSENYECVDLCEIKEEVKEEVDFELNTSTELSYNNNNNNKINKNNNKNNINNNNNNNNNSHRRAIAVTHHSGDPRYKRIVNRRVEFGPLSTISAPYAVVPARVKAWYEVRYVCRGFGSDSGVQRVGWCSSRLPRTRFFTGHAVGDDLESYSFDPFHGHKYNRGKCVWGQYFEREGVGYVGAALDMINGEILFSLNGIWNEPMGVAFNELPRNAKLFPAISGCDVTVEVNFGEQEFVCGPPDGTYVPLNSL